MKKNAKKLAGVGNILYLCTRFLKERCRFDNPFQAEEGWVSG
jgi:hypothetical protein